MKKVTGLKLKLCMTSHAAVVAHIVAQDAEGRVVFSPPCGKPVAILIAVLYSYCNTHTCTLKLLQMREYDFADALQIQATFQAYLDLTEGSAII